MNFDVFVCLLSYGYTFIIVALDVRRGMSEVAVEELVAGNERG